MPGINWSNAQCWPQESQTAFSPAERHGLLDFLRELAGDESLFPDSMRYALSAWKVLYAARPEV
jgi:hypothetical protein